MRSTISAWLTTALLGRDALVTAQGCEILSASAPKSVTDIEALMRGRHA